MQGSAGGVKGSRLASLPWRLGRTRGLAFGTQAQNTGALKVSFLLALVPVFVEVDSEDEEKDDPVKVILNILKAQALSHYLLLLLRKSFPGKVTQVTCQPVSLETTKIVPVDLLNAWGHSISSLESPFSPTMSDVVFQPRTLNFMQSASADLPRHCVHFQFPDVCTAGERRVDEDTVECVQQQELQPLMLTEDDSRPAPSAGLEPGTSLIP